MQIEVRDVRIPTIQGAHGSIDGSRTVFLDGGQGDCILFAHGSGVGGSGQLAWRAVAEELAPDYRVIAPDLLWSGASDVPDLPYSLEAQADQLRGLLDVLGIERCAVVGQSMGAYVAARFACDHPDRVTHLCLVASNTVSLAMGLDLPPTPGLAAKEAVDGSRERTRSLLSTLYERSELITEEEVDAWTAIARRPGMEQARESLARYVSELTNDPERRQSFSLVGRLDRLSLPMALIWGRQDRFASPELASRLMAMIPFAMFTEIDGGGHGVFRDRPRKFAETVRAFLASW
jgi:pimeloyl-ACP methyl ester carboxylesterase